MFVSSRRSVRRAAVLAAVLSGGCATTARNEASTLPSSDDESERIAELETRIVELEASLERARMSAPSREVVRIDASTRGEAPPDVEPPEVPRERDPVVLRLHEEPTTTFEVPTTTERLAVVPMPDPIVVASSTPTTLPTPSVVEDDRAYREGLAHLTARRFEQAIASLSNFLRDHPGSERADDALYWRATASYALRRYDAALVDYERVPRIAPRGERAADAIYHAGLCHRHLGATAAAARSFARVRREYPDSGAARLAAGEDST